MGAAWVRSVVASMLKRKKWCDPGLMYPSILTMSTSWPHGLPNCWHLKTSLFGGTLKALMVSVMGWSSSASGMSAS